MHQTWTLAAVSLRAAVDLALVDRHGLRAVSPATARWFRNAARRLTDHLDEDIPVHLLTPQQVSNWLQSEHARGLAAVSANSNLRAIKTLYSRLERNGIVSSNPAAPVAPLPEPPPRPKAISEPDYQAMRAAADNARDRAIVDVLWSSGCRLGGLVSMRVDRLEHWQQGGRDCYALLVVEKYSKPRWVYVGRHWLQSHGLRAWLDERPACGHRALFVTLDAPHGQLSPVAVQHVLRKLRTAAGIPPGRPTNAHAFRHAFAIRMLDEGHDLAAVSAWLGHASPEFTAAVYVVRPESLLRQKYFMV